MKTQRRKYNIFEKMEMEWAKTDVSGPVEAYVLTEEEFEEFKINAHNYRTSFKKIVGRTNDDIGGDWHYRGALIKVEKKK